ncbi:hypothetical protein INS49_008900 [Diaporthe citri]|uniref:uncharacterized protein n=1 Tax=Diaporthe citri TaxID=83186 RepID=UPI001C815192|nr:uncharacterized protein INS49_008900 [Diaporthe citri]KAG6363797.1 hypothetical protein INS49_008900 [Diaporthe citri]
MLVPSKRCCFAPEPEIPREHLSTMSDGNLGLLAAAACGAKGSGGDDPNVNMVHLELYQHFSQPPSSNYFFCLATPEMAAAMKASALELSVHVPYLMHQLLAISARDKSRHAADEDRRAAYLRLALQLQTHAITIFNASSPVLPSLTNPRQSTPVLAFSAMLGTHGLCDTLTALDEQPSASQPEADECQQRNSLQDFLGRWLDYIRLHRSVSSHALAASDLAHPSSDPQPLLQHGRAMAERQPAGHETDALLARVAALQGLSPEVLAACLTAVDGLQVAIDMGNDAPSSASSAEGGSATAATASPEHLPIWWALSVPDAFVEALSTGLPELVAVLAYYAVLLHRARSCWAVGPAAGTRLLQVLTAHLGLKYTEVLAYPRKELGLGHLGAVYDAIRDQ